MVTDSALINWMLTMVIEKPMQLTIVSDVPLDCAGADWATMVENKGESAMTTNPQKTRKTISTGAEAANRNKGDTMQHAHDSNSDKVAIRLAPKRCESRPLTTQASPPDAIMIKDSNGTFRWASG